MSEKRKKSALEPNVEKPLFRRKTFFEVAAVQSSVGNVNPDLPVSLLTPMIAVLDPCTWSSTVHARINWNRVTSRLARDQNPEDEQERGRSQQTGGQRRNYSNSPVGVRSRSDSPRNPAILKSKNGGVEKQNMGPTRGMSAEQQKMRKENLDFIEEVVELIGNIRKYADPVLSSNPTWIEKTKIKKISQQIVLIHSYSPGLVNIDDIVNAMLFENGPSVLENLIIDMPENVLTIVNLLINKNQQGIQMKYRNETIAKVIEIYPHLAHRIIDKFTKLRSDCIYGSRLAVQYFGDRHFLEFLEPALADRESNFSKTVLRSAGRGVLSQIIERLLHMAQHVLDWQASPSSSDAPEMGESPWCTRLSFCLVDLLNQSVEVWKEKDIITLSRFLFRTTTSPTTTTTTPSESIQPPEEPMDLSFHEEDYADSLDSVVPDSDPESQAAHRPRVPAGIQVELSPFGDAHEIFVLSALIAVPCFTQYPINQTGAVQPPDRAVDVWLDMSRKRVLMGKKVTSSFGTRLIHVHSCIMSSRIEELEDFASEGVRRRVELAKEQNHTLVLKNTFTSRCMTEIEVAKRSVCQLVTKSIEISKTDKKSADSLALRSIHALQTAGVYKTFQIDIGEWLEEQLEHISLPASALLADVVDGFAQSSAHHVGKGLKEEFVENAFNGDIFDGRNISKRLFVMLYLCSYRETVHKSDSSLRTLRYSISLYKQIPVRYLLSFMEQQHENFENVRSKIMTRTAVIFPYMLPTVDSMNLVGKYQESAGKEVVEEEEFGSDREKRVQMIREQHDVIRILEAIDKSSVRDQLAALPVFLEVYQQSLNTHFTHGYAHLLISLYHRYEQLDPRTLFEKSVQMLLAGDEVTVEDVEKFPSLLFRCDRRIMSSPPHFHCFIRCLNFFNKMVRAENRLRLLMVAQLVFHAHPHMRDELEKQQKEEELINGAYQDNQHSALIHALIEVCDSKRMGDDTSDFTIVERRRQIRKIACDYIHRQFLDYEGLIRIVLHQKFPLHQVRDIVEGVPALFAGNAQILEMLSLADQQRRIFAVVFAAEICRKYRVRESLEAARTVCDIVHSLHKFGELPSSNKLWKHVAPALMLLATEFPSLCDSISRLLLRVQANAKNRLAVRCGLLAGDPRHEEYELIKTVSMFLDKNLIKKTL